MTHRNEAYAEGVAANQRGESKSANPYDLSDETENHLAWNDGWDSAEGD